jgi:hypothetical protein
MKTAFPPRGPRSNLIKLWVTADERRTWEDLARARGTTVTEAVKEIMREASRAELQTTRK